MAVQRTPNPEGGVPSITIPHWCCCCWWWSQSPTGKINEAELETMANVLTEQARLLNQTADMARQAAKRTRTG